MPKISPPRGPRVSRLGWILTAVGACSVYDPSLLSEDRSTRPETGGFSATGGDKAGLGGSPNPGSGGLNSAGSSAGGGEDGGQSNTGGDVTSRGGTSQGGSDTGGSDTGGTAKGGALSSGGVSQGGAPATGGTPTGGTPTGGTVSTGGKSTGGSATGGAASGGTSTGGKSTGGSATGGGGSTSTGGSSGGSDGCPDDPNKTAPGVCGCGIPEQDTATTAGCLGLRSALIHRYNFSNTTSMVSDSVGTAHGTAVNATPSNGTITLAGGTSDQYVDLPNRLLSPLTDATLEVWLTWNGGANWQRVFDFGSSTGSEGVRATGVTYLFLTPKAASGNVNTAFSLNGTGSETAINGTGPLPTSMKTHVSVVVNDTADQMQLYVNGTVAGSTAFTGHLSGLNDINDWLGRSQFTGDAGFAGILHEFRIYQSALTAAQIQLTEQTGESPAFL